MYTFRIGSLSYSGPQVTRQRTRRDLPDGDVATDKNLSDYADGIEAIIISKDKDFVNSHRISGSPGRLISVKLGNCSNNALIECFESLLPEITSAFRADFRRVELYHTHLIMHRAPSRPSE